MIYETILGQQFQWLHPKLQQRYRLPVNQPFIADGVMQAIMPGPKLLKPMYQLFAQMKFLFPESGYNIPFTITNTTTLNAEQQAEVRWQRAFYFPQHTRYFNATMTADLKRLVVKDYLGEPSLFYSDLQFNVTKEGFLVIRSGAQRAVVGNVEIPLPKQLSGRVIVTEGYDDIYDRFTIHVTIYNDLFGRMMMYAGHFCERQT